MSVCVRVKVKCNEQSREERGETGEWETENYKEEEEREELGRLCCRLLGGPWRAEARARTYSEQRRGILLYRAYDLMEA